MIGYTTIGLWGWRWGGWGGPGWGGGGLGVIRRWSLRFWRCLVMSWVSLALSAIVSVRLFISSLVRVEVRVAVVYMVEVRRRRSRSWHCPILICSSFRSALAVTLRAACPLAVVKRRREGGVTISCLHLWLNVR
jgi:hypothetical protein